MTPQGRSWTLILRMTVRVARSTTETSFDGPLAVKSVLPSGESAIPHGRGPTSKEAVTAFVAVSMIKTLRARPVLT